MAHITTGYQKVWRLNEWPRVGDTFEIDGQDYTIFDIEEVKTRYGKPATVLTVGGDCRVCGDGYSFTTTRTGIRPIRTCQRHRGKGGSRKKQNKPALASKVKPAPKVKSPPVLRPPVPKIGERLSYKDENCTVAKILPSMKAEIDFDDNTYDTVDYRKLRRAR